MRYRRLVTAGVAAVGAVFAWRRRDAGQRDAVVRRIEPPQSRPTVKPISAHGTVLLPFGRYFASRADMLTRRGFKTIEPIDGISPFTAVDDPDPDMAHFAEGERANARVKADVRKDFATRLAQSGADYLVVDNTSALLLHREVNGRLYVVIPGEKTELTDALWNGDEATARRVTFRASHDGFTERLRDRYDAFVTACLATFDPSRIVLIRSHTPRFWVGDDGTIAPTNLNRSDARLLDELDEYFVAQTGCRVSTAALDHFPNAEKWQTSDDELRTMLEAELVQMCTSSVPSRARRHDPALPDSRRNTGAADHVIGAFRRGRSIDANHLREFFAKGGATSDDLLALAFLEQWQPDGYGDLVRECVKHAVADAASRPLAETRRRFDRSLVSLRDREQDSARLPSGDLWEPQITIKCRQVVMRFLGDGSIQRFLTTRVGVKDAAAIADGSVPITALNLTEVIRSWPVYLERGRRGITTALRVVVPDTAALVDTCYWIDWAWVLDNERIILITPGDPEPSLDDMPDARTDVSFIFDPNVRVCTVGGGLMDQLTHIALFDQICARHGLDYYLDDFRYIWWRSHNGFEASRLAPELERRRMTRLVSQALLESFRRDVMKTRLPWAFNQSRVWYDVGLRDAMVVTRDYVNSRQLMQIGPDFPVLVYTESAELDELMRVPPRPVTFFTTQHRIAVAPESADALRRVFSYRHLEAAGIDPDVTRMAEVLRAEPHVAFHVRRGDYLNAHFDRGGWHSRHNQYIDAITFLIDSEFGTSDFNVAVFSDDVAFVEANEPAYGLDRVAGDIRYIRGNTHFKSIFDSYLMSLCPVIIGSVGNFAATTSLLADPPSVFIRARPEGASVAWRR